MLRPSPSALALAALLAACARAPSSGVPVDQDTGALGADVARDAATPDTAAPPDAAPGDVPTMDVPTMDVPTMDAPTPDAAPEDAAPPDAPRADVAADTSRADARDAAPVDAGRPCACPTVPATCTPVAAGTPAFGPWDDALQTQLGAVLACADREVHAALYEVTWGCAVEAFVARLAADADLRVSLVYDDEECPRESGRLACELARLDGHPRVTLVPDARSALMHHKFLVVDGARVWVASANMTRQSFCTDSNNALVVEEPAVVMAYEAEFQRMFGMRQFGPIAPEPMPARGGAYTVYFSPRSPATTAAPWFTEMVTAIGAARTSVEFLVSAWTRTELSDAMIAAHRRGVRVRGVVSRLYGDGAPAMALRAAGVPMRVGDVHDKLLVVDGGLVITGSANWSANAWANNESSLWVRDAALAARYAAAVERVFAAAREP